MGEIKPTVGQNTDNFEISAWPVREFKDGPAAHPAGLNVLIEHYGEKAEFQFEITQLFEAANAALGMLIEDLFAAEAAKDDEIEELKAELAAKEAEIEGLQADVAEMACCCAPAPILVIEFTDADDEVTAFI